MRSRPSTRASARLLDVLDETGLAENTLVVYTSDQGFFLGEHGWFDKRFMYEESLRMPLVMRFPGRIRPGSVNERHRLEPRLRPDFPRRRGPRQARRDAGPVVPGRSSSAGRVAGWPESFYYHYYEFPAVHMAKRHYGVRTRRYKLIHFYHDIDAWELYDLEKDPLEMRNVYGDPAYAAVRAGLEAELRRLQAFYRDSEELARRFVRADTGK